MTPEAQDLAAALYVSLICVGVTRWLTNLAYQAVTVALYERAVQKRKRGEGK